MKHNLFVVVFVCFLFGFFNGCARSESSWRGTTEEIEGVTVVRNPTEPVFGEVVLDLQENLSIGGDGDDNTLFYRARDIEVDPSGNIFVVDSGNHRIQKFDARGGYLRTIGRKGEGPGEFSWPFGLRIGGQGDLYVREYRKIQVFDRAGEFSRMIPLNTTLVDFALDGGGGILAQADLRPRDPALRAIVRIDPRGELIQKIAEYHDRGIQIVITQSRTITLSPNHAYSPRLCFAALGRDTFVYGYSSDYLLTLIDKEASVVMKISKDEIPRDISRDEKNILIDKALASAERSRVKIPRKKIVETLHFEESRAFFNKIITDDHQRIYIQKIRSVLAEGEPYRFDVFDRSGHYLHVVTIPISPDVIRKGFLYDLVTSPDTGEITVKRYRIMNWGRLITGL